MKKIILIIASILLATVSDAQITRHRKVPTIVQDVLAQMPTNNKEDFDREIRDIAKCAEQSIPIMANMFMEPGQAINSKLEYALQGVVAYSTEHVEFKDQVRAGYTTVLKSDADKRVKTFMLTQFRLISTEEDIPTIVPFAYDPEFSNVAIATLTSTPGGKTTILNLIKEDKAERTVLAQAASELKLSEAEPYILKWNSEIQNEEERYFYASVLSSCGTKASLKSVKAMDDQLYLALLHRLPAQGEGALACKLVKKLFNSDNISVKNSALALLIEVKGMEASKEILKALKSEDMKYRCATLKKCEEIAQSDFHQFLAKNFDKLSGEAKRDVIYWIGENQYTEQIPILESQLKADEPLAKESIAALAKIGNSKSVELLLAELSTPLYECAEEALKFCKGDIDLGIKEIILNSNVKDARLAALHLAHKRGCRVASEAVFQLLDSDNEDIKSTAYETLEGVVRFEDKERLAALEDKLSEEYENDLENAFVSIFKQDESDETYSLIAEMEEESEKPYLYYPSYAMLNDEEASSTLAERYAENAYPENALEAMMMISDFSVAEYLYKIGVEKDSEDILQRYATVILESELPDPEKYLGLEPLFKMDIDDEMKQELLYNLAGLNNIESMLLAASYLDNDATDHGAACAVKEVAAKCHREIELEKLMPILQKAKKVFEKKEEGDDIYYLAELEEFMGSIKHTESEPVYELTEEEKERGFEILFDGTNLDKWICDNKLYKIVNGAITVCANFGGDNLYTKEEYRNFVFRFEFCFTKPGANNGVGVRTPMGVDAAYHAMCEVQILDHDDPIYYDLNKYQVHGSVYGVIPAKRIVHKPLGEWGYEEIEVIDDHIKVTVNGEVIVDGNIREACQGHNVAPDGGDYNPYTVDHENHPGMFNEKGHVGFLGHGAGLKIKNVRILNLDK